MVLLNPKHYPLVEAIDEWRKDLPHNEYKQRVMRGWHSMPELHEEILAHASEIGRKSEKPSKEPLDLNSMVTSVWNREKVAIQLGLVEEVLKKVQSGPPLLIVGDSPEAVKARNIEAVQRAWLEDPEMRTHVNDFKNELERAMEAYNNQIIVDKLRHLFFTAGPFDLETVKKAFGHPAWQKMSEAEIKESFQDLEDHFYHEGNHHFVRLGEHYAALAKHPAGQFFTVPLEMMKELLGQRKSHAARSEIEP